MSYPSFYSEADKKLYDMLEKVSFFPDFDGSDRSEPTGVNYSTVCAPDEEYSFLHEAAVIAFDGVLFAAWYQNPKYELNGRTPIFFSRSSDGGKTWDKKQTVADDPTGRILYCPPVFGIDGGRLYMLLNEMVSADHIHALDLYTWNEASSHFDFLWSRPIPFKLNTNVYRLANGKLFLPGRVAEPDGFPNTPAALISDSGRIDADWRLIYIQKDGKLPDGAEYEHPELTAVECGRDLWVFSRNDQRHISVVYRSSDHGETYSAVMAHDIPLWNSKIYSGTLSDGRNYLIGNLPCDRSRLCLFVNRKGEMRFDKAYLIGSVIEGVETRHYPVAFEDGGRLYIIFTYDIEGKSGTRGAMCAAVQIQNL